MGIKESCRKHFRELQILPMRSQYIYLLALFVIDNRQYFEINTEIHNINTRTKFDMHYPWTEFGSLPEGNLLCRDKDFKQLTCCNKRAVP
jgi:hypothetical protein